MPLSRKVIHIFTKHGELGLVQLIFRSLGPTLADKGLVSAEDALNLLKDIE